MVVNARAAAVSSEVGEWRPATVESVAQTASLLQAPPLLTTLTARKVKMEFSLLLLLHDD
jgi:hypothetical protein